MHEKVQVKGRDPFPLTFCWEGTAGVLNLLLGSTAQETQAYWSKSSYGCQEIYKEGLIHLGLFNM